MDVQKILALLPHRFPFLMIDRVIEVDPGVRAVAIKCVSVNEPQFQGHFPSQPILPGVLLVEAFAQVAGVVALTARPDMAGRTVLLLGLDKTRFRKPITPGDRVTLTVEKLWEKRGIWKFNAFAEVDGERVGETELMATVQDSSP